MRLYKLVCWIFVIVSYFSLLALGLTFIFPANPGSGGIVYFISLGMFVFYRRQASQPEITAASLLILGSTVVLYLSPFIFLYFGFLHYCATPAAQNYGHPSFFEWIFDVYSHFFTEVSTTFASMSLSQGQSYIIGTTMSFVAQGLELIWMPLASILSFGMLCFLLSHHEKLQAEQGAAATP